MNEHEEHIKNGMSYKCDCLICQQIQMGEYKPDVKRISYVAYRSNSMTDAGRIISTIGHRKPHYRPAQ